MSADFFVHPSSAVHESAKIGAKSQIWMGCQIRDRAVLGKNCILGKSVYIDSGVSIGNNVKIQNNVSVFHGVEIEDGVFVGPHVCFTNDKLPRAINPDGTLKAASDWTVTPTLVKMGAALGANSTLICGITVGKWALVGSGSVVTKDVPDHGLVVGNPARLIGYACACGKRLTSAGESRWACECGKTYSLPAL